MYEVLFIARYEAIWQILAKGFLFINFPGLPGRLLREGARNDGGLLGVRMTDIY